MQFNNKAIVTDYADKLLSENDYEAPRFKSHVKLTAAAREWDARYFNRDPWPSLAVKDKDKNGKAFMRAVHPSDNTDVLHQNKWFAPDILTKDGREQQLLLRPADGQYPKFFIHRYAATAEEIEWAKENGKPSTAEPFRYGTDKCEERGAYRDAWTGTGSKDAPDGAIWGYNIVTQQSGKLKRRIDNYEGIDLNGHQPQFSSVYSVGNENTLCVPNADEVTIRLEPSIAGQVFGPRHAKSPRKYQYKSAALNRSLNALFSPRDLRPIENFELALSLESTKEDEAENWMPVTDGGLDEMLAAEEMKRRQREAASQLEAIKKAIGDDKYKMLVQSAMGKTNQEISDELRANGKDVSTDAVKKALQRIRKQLTQLKGDN